MNTEFLRTEELPYCKGCGHHIIARDTAAALARNGLSPLDVVLVTDIGCQGIVDRCFATHTVHGLHGRAVALGAGIAMGLGNSRKKVVVFIGDGGATIGLQHILEAARLNVEMTVLVHNNMLYGMTGGQSSGLTPEGFRTILMPEGKPTAGYDICALARAAGASHVRRVIAKGDLSQCLAEAFDAGGFSLVEAVEWCPTYGGKLNRGLKLETMLEESGQELGIWRAESEREPFRVRHCSDTSSLFDSLIAMRSEGTSPLDGQRGVVLGGSAGEGVQVAARILSLAAIESGLYVAKKGSYPVTVGTGFSTADVILSPTYIYFHGTRRPGLAVITSQQGLEHNRERIEKMDGGELLIDESLEPPTTGARVVSHPFREMGARNAATYAVYFLAHRTGWISAEALSGAVRAVGLTDRIPEEMFREALDCRGSFSMGRRATP